MCQQQRHSRKPTRALPQSSKDFDIVAWNAIPLLIALHIDRFEAESIMLHFWYSALIVEAILRSLQEKILPLIEEVCAKIKDKATNLLRAKTWRYGKISLCLTLQKSTCDLFPSYL